MAENRACCSAGRSTRRSDGVRGQHSVLSSSLLYGNQQHQIPTICQTILVATVRQKRGPQIITLTHNHDVCIGKKGPVCVGGLALIHGAVGCFGVVQHYRVAQNPPVGRRRICRDTRQTCGGSERPCSWLSFSYGQMIDDFAVFR